MNKEAGLIGTHRYPDKGIHLLPEIRFCRDKLLARRGWVDTFVGRYIADGCRLGYIAQDLHHLYEGIQHDYCKLVPMSSKLNCFGIENLGRS